MNTNVFWVPGPWRGRLGIVPRPRGGDWLDDEMKAWRQASIDVVVSLLEPGEQAELMLEREATAAAASGVAFHAFPIPDRGVPLSQESVAALATRITEALTAVGNVAVHCRQGIGRSALIVGAVLVAAGQPAAVALRTIEKARGTSVPDTEQQRLWLRDFAEWLSVKGPSADAPPVRRVRGRPETIDDQ